MEFRPSAYTVNTFVSIKFTVVVNVKLLIILASTLDSVLLPPLQCQSVCMYLVPVAVQCSSSMKHIFVQSLDSDRPKNGVAQMIFHRIGPLFAFCSKVLFN